MLRGEYEVILQLYVDTEKQWSVDDNKTEERNGSKRPPYILVSKVKYLFGKVEDLYSKLSNYLLGNQLRERLGERD